MLATNHVIPVKPLLLSLVFVLELMRVIDVSAQDSTRSRQVVVGFHGQVRSCLVRNQDVTVTRGKVVIGKPYTRSYSEYNKQGQLLQDKQFEEGKIEEITVYLYDSLHRWIGTDSRGARGKLQPSMRYKYNDSGRVAQITTYDNGKASERLVYEYDSLNFVRRTVHTFAPEWDEFPIITIHSSDRYGRISTSREYDGEGDPRGRIEFAYDTLTDKELGTVLYRAFEDRYGFSGGHTDRFIVQVDTAGIVRFRSRSFVYDGDWYTAWDYRYDGMSRLIYSSELTDDGYTVELYDRFDTSNNPRYLLREYYEYGRSVPYQADVITIEYVYDAQENWIKQTRSKRRLRFGEPVEEPYWIATREIVYY